QAGERTKISVYSKNDKVDSVGACVGMRGNRVRNIVNELYEEKIDIVRFNEDFREYIKNALSPAKVAEIKLNKEKLKAEVIVEDDQLSLAIGKHGQNVRLASKLIGWDLDIRTKAMQTEILAKAEADKVLSRAKPEEAPVQGLKKKARKLRSAKFSLEELPGIGEKTLENLKGSGINSLEDLISLKEEGLVKIKGIGEKKAAKLIADAKKLK
ncbi:MAG: KH domain-containing protein, partial [Candidatus Omnitrophica bacterium]|nr:KH domain-containing protein [Candidatus Omnitrophota bacterium]